MKKKKLLYGVVLLFSIVMIVGCSNDDDAPEPVDNSSFITSSETDFFINFDGSINLIITGEYIDSQLKNVAKRGWVYGKTANQGVGADNVIEVLAPSPMTGTIENLPADESYYVRGFLKYEDGTYFYGNEIQISTDVDASDSRSIILAMEDMPHWLTSDEMTPVLNLSGVLKEIPREIGFEYSVNQDFSGSSSIAISSYTGFTRGRYMKLIENLTPATTYYIRPYAKYTDDVVTNGGTSVVIITTLASSNQ